MIILDTCAIIFDALAPSKLTSQTKKVIAKAEESQQLACSDISLWEIGMLILKKRIEPGIDTETFLQLVFKARQIEVVPIGIGIATLATTLETPHLDPADRIIAATTIHYQGSLITCDKKLQLIPQLVTLW